MTPVVLMAVSGLVFLGVVAVPSKPKIRWVVLAHLVLMLGVGNFMFHLITKMA